MSGSTGSARCYVRPPLMEEDMLGHPSNGLLDEEMIVYVYWDGVAGW